MRDTGTAMLNKAMEVDVSTDHLSSAPGDPSGHNQPLNFYRTTRSAAVHSSTVSSEVPEKSALGLSLTGVSGNAELGTIQPQSASTPVLRGRQALRQLPGHSTDTAQDLKGKGREASSSSARPAAHGNASAVTQQAGGGQLDSSLSVTRSGGIPPPGPRHPSGPPFGLPVVPTPPAAQSPPSRGRTLVDALASHQANQPIIQVAAGTRQGGEHISFD
jgi:hypothetical protein